IPSKLVTPKEAKEIIPHLDENQILGGTFCRKDGHLNPFHATQAYANAAARLGVTILKRTKVTSIDIKNGKITGVQTDKGYISTSKVLDAAGGYSKEIADMVNVDLPVFSERHQILVTEPVEYLQGPMYMGFVHNIYCQQTPHGSFIMGRGDKTEPCGTKICSGWAFMEEMAKNCVKLMPLLAELTVVRQWAGLYNMSPDRQPIYGMSDKIEGFYMAAGFSGHGFMFGPVTGVVMAETILGLTPSIDISKLSYDRFKKGELFVEPSVV
ncbi:MAG TPA: FAD-binding oxidoreductase, partial [Clostridia bacterium]|nr:FAD-binding oxidoreductase [Clostridia bacterium]